jgi:LysR family hydrogen peroxide-inducible transcriptional activator
LDEGEYDFIFSTMPIQEVSLEVFPLFREPIYLVVNSNHPLANETELAPRQLKGLEILTIQENYLFNRQIEELSKRFNARLLRDYEGTSLDAIRQMVYLEMGVAFLPALYVRSEIRDREDLRVLKVKGEPIFRLHALAWRKSSTHGQYYRQFAELFQSVAGSAFGDDAILV